MRLRDKIIDQRRRDPKAGSLGGRVDLLQTFVVVFIASSGLVTTKSDLY